jgi:hypothetical protein
MRRTGLHLVSMLVAVTPFLLLGGTPTVFANDTPPARAQPGISTSGDHPQLEPAHVKASAADSPNCTKPVDGRMMCMKAAGLATTSPAGMATTGTIQPIPTTCVGDGSFVFLTSRTSACRPMTEELDTYQVLSPDVLLQTGRVVFDVWGYQYSNADLPEYTHQLSLASVPGGFGPPCRVPLQLRPTVFATSRGGPSRHSRLLPQT